MEVSQTGSATHNSKRSNVVRNKVDIVGKYAVWNAAMVWQSVIDKSFPEGRHQRTSRIVLNPIRAMKEMTYADSQSDGSQSVVLCSGFNKKETFKSLKTDAIADSNE